MILACKLVEVIVLGGIPKFITPGYYIVHFL